MAQAIISPDFCSSYSVDLRIVRLVPSGDFSVKDVIGKTVFKIKGTFFSLHDRRVIVNGAGYPIVTLQKKWISTHHRWKIYRGDSTDSRNLIFSVKKSSVVQWKTNLHVFLAHNQAEHTPDFKVKGSWFERSCVVFAGKSKSSNIVAQVRINYTVTSVLFGKDNFRVTVYPGVDQAFIVALIVILDEINSSGSGSSGSGDGD
ncbi:protein LURP-one-related 15-like [Argentina anserina]|uniref:protein LURP-one-related 15-like n=1 Tax=Argentina anserina TaxID=57926 RepID=UPI00217668D3|nr:protein LURP-one-related 15-like [Potentilla anserina]